MHHQPGKFANVQCEDCGLIRLSPRPTADSLGSYYPDEKYYSYSQTSPIVEHDSYSLRDDIRQLVISSFGYRVSPNSSLVKLFAPILIPIFRKKAAFGFGDRFPRHVPNGRALDIGCGSGVFLSILKSYGWRVQGIELKQTAADAAKENHGIDVFVGNLIDARLDENSFDFISFNHSLEHMPNIIEVLTEVKRILKPGGIAYIEVPNVESLSRRISGEYWLHWDAPRHLFSFSRGTLQRLLVKVGFAKIEVGTFRADFYLSDLRYKREDLGKRGDVDPVSRVIDRIWAKCLGLSTDLFYLFDRGSGDYISCFARKDT